MGTAARVPSRGSRNPGCCTVCFSSDRASCQPEGRSGAAAGAPSEAGPRPPRQAGRGGAAGRARSASPPRLTSSRRDGVSRAGSGVPAVPPRAVPCRSVPMAARAALRQTARLASSSALLQVRAAPGPPSPSPPASRPPRRRPWEPARPPGSASRPASSAGAVPGGHLRAERPDAALPLPGAPRRRQREVMAVPPSGRGAGGSLPRVAVLSLRARCFCASGGAARQAGLTAGARGGGERGTDCPPCLLQADSALFHGRVPGQGGVPQGLLERRRGAELGCDHQPAVADVRAAPLFFRTRFSFLPESSRDEDAFPLPVFLLEQRDFKRESGSRNDLQDVLRV